MRTSSGRCALDLGDGTSPTSRGVGRDLDQGANAQPTSRAWMLPASRQHLPATALEQALRLDKARPTQPHNDSPQESRMQFHNTSDATLPTGTNKQDARKELHAKLLSGDQKRRARAVWIDPRGSPTWLRPIGPPANSHQPLAS